MGKWFHLSLYLVIFVKSLFLFSPAPVFASGFIIGEKSIKDMGTAFAGGAAAAEDISTIYYNPAGLTVVPGSQFKLGGISISPTLKFSDKGSTAVTGQPLTGSDGGNAGIHALVPNVYLSHEFTHKLKTGIGVFVPFGLGSDYDPDWKGRYHSIKSEVKSLDINPTVAYRIDDMWSVGFGVSVQQLDAELSSAIDYGTINAYYGLGLPLIPQQSDGKSALAADDWGYGFNFGFLCEVSENTRFGLAYRSRITYELKGNAEFTTPPEAALIASLQKLTNTSGSADLETPDSLSISGYHKFHDAWAVMVDITWTNWRVMDELRVKFDNGAADSVVTFDWNDVFRYALGVVHTYNSQWTFRCGAAFDESPVPDARRRTPRIPDVDRYWISLGTSFQWSERFSIDVAYTNIIASEDALIDKAAIGEDLFRGALKGSFDAVSHLVGVQFGWQF